MPERSHVPYLRSSRPSAALAAGSPQALGLVSATVTAGARLGWRQRPGREETLRFPPQAAVSSRNQWSSPVARGLLPLGTPCPISSATLRHPKMKSCYQGPQPRFLLLASPHFLWAAWTRPRAPAPSNPLCNNPPQAGHLSGRGHYLKGETAVVHHVSF